MAWYLILMGFSAKGQISFLNTRIHMNNILIKHKNPTHAHNIR